MKEMNLFLVGVVLLLGFAGFAYAEVDNASDSFENGTVIVLNNSNVSVVLSPDALNGYDTVGSDDSGEPNEINETPLDENQMEQADLIIEDEEVIVYRESASNRVVSYVSGVVDKINEIHENLFFVIIIILGVLLLFVYSIFFDYSSAKACFSKASSLHRKGERAHVKGDYMKAKKLYGKSYLFREKGEGIVSGGADGNAI